MERFRAALQRLMYGRYGVDELYYALLVLWLVLWVVQIFLPWRAAILVPMLVLLYAMFRVFSRNIPRRRAENDWYRRKREALQRRGRLMRRRWAERKTHAYKTCPHCRAVVRLARVKGKHTCTCPRCRRDFPVRM